MHPRRLPPADLPRVWLFTDPRLGDRLWAALDRLPRGSGVVLRDYGHRDRLALARRLRAETRRRGLTLLVAGDVRLARRIGADGVHWPRWAAQYWRHDGWTTAAAHSLAELRDAERAGADLVFLSPLFATASHPGARSLGRVRFGLLARAAHAPVAALGGMTKGRFEKLRGLGAVGWGAIDAFTRD